MASASRPVEIPLGAMRLAGDLTLPHDARGIVLFAHGSGSSRASPRNRAVAATLANAQLATLLLDLLTSEEERGEQAGGRMRFDIQLLSSRLEVAINWLARGSETHQLALGLFGASTGAAAALVAAAEQPTRVRAVVSRGGRPDLAGAALARVECPTLLIVGGADREVLELNRAAMVRIGDGTQLVVIRGATHLFEEPGALENVARLARDWFLRYLGARASAAGE